MYKQSATENPEELKGKYITYLTMEKDGEEDGYNENMVWASIKDVIKAKPFDYLLITSNIIIKNGQNYSYHMGKERLLPWSSVRRLPFKVLDIDSIGFTEVEQMKEHLLLAALDKHQVNPLLLIASEDIKKKINDPELHEILDKNILKNPLTKKHDTGN